MMGVLKFRREKLAWKNLGIKMDASREFILFHFVEDEQMDELSKYFS
jgi:hypothetical protein